MEDTRDYLGDLFQGAITHGQGGQFFTPESLSELMAQLTADQEQPASNVIDPCCGSGRLLLSAAKHHRGAELVGQDIDLRCVRMTAINLALRNLYGYVLWGNSLRVEAKRGYRTGFNLHGTVIRPMREDELERYGGYVATEPSSDADAPTGERGSGAVDRDGQRWLFL
jgi:hypothetical protein